MLFLVPLQALLNDPRNGGGLNIGYPCSQRWCSTDAQVYDK
jgi:hypothetical protein